MRVLLFCGLCRVRVFFSIMSVCLKVFFVILIFCWIYCGVSCILMCRMWFFVVRIIRLWLSGRIVMVVRCVMFLGLRVLCFILSVSIFRLSLICSVVGGVSIFVRCCVLCVMVIVLSLRFWLCRCMVILLLRFCILVLLMFVFLWRCLFCLSVR